MSASQRDPPFDVCGPLPHGRDRARGERRHRQDVHDRRAGRALRRRGHAARAAPARDLHAHGDRRAARARPRAARQRRAGPRPRARRARRPRTTTSSRCSPTGPQRRGRRSGASASPRALADFDAATIATTHGFCQEVLGGLGVAGDVEPDATFVEDVSDLRRRGRRRPLRAPLPRQRRAAVRPRARRCGSRAIAVDNPAARARAARTRRSDTVAAMRAPPRRAPCATSSSAASAQWRS